MNTGRIPHTASERVRRAPGHTSQTHTHRQSHPAHRGRLLDADDGAGILELRRGRLAVSLARALLDLLGRALGEERLRGGLLHALLLRTELLHKTGLDGRRLTNRQLSTGQRKRLALVLALLADKPVLLLDEWAAEQDPAFRRLFYRELLPELRAAGRTVVAVTHDDEHYGVADRVLRMQYGKFVPAA